MANLREGFTTGTAAAAAAKAGVLFLEEGTGKAVEVPLPAGGRLAIPIARYEEEGAGVRVTVVKDGGDDPDVTHGAEIQAVVTLNSGLRGERLSWKGEKVSEG
jgi:cobalt-precorrin-5B (C1)-methyltransferase